jgi:hypothetical protein
MALRSKPTAGRLLPPKDPRPIREGVDLTPPFEAKGRRLLWAQGPVSRFLKCVQKSMSSGHGAGSGRSNTWGTYGSCCHAPQRCRPPPQRRKNAVSFCGDTRRRMRNGTAATNR